jgi:hypothetical protein
MKLASDENFDLDIVRGLLRILPDLDIVRVQDADLAGSPEGRKSVSVSMTRGRHPRG